APATVYIRNARGMFLQGRWGDGWRLASKAWQASPDPALRRDIVGLLPFALRRMARGVIPR
ncbi:MAG: hypothetical protein LH470_07575, partial [Lysobacter sp.]|nr:hypothetical protein [Lysobacter sp.]